MNIGQFSRSAEVKGHVTQEKLKICPWLHFEPDFLTKYNTNATRLLLLIEYTLGQFIRKG